MIGRLLREERGTAIVEFVFVAIGLLVPLVYFLVAISVLQGAAAAVGQEARDAGRAIATATSYEAGLARARIAIRLALDDRGVVGTPELTFVGAADACDRRLIEPEFVAGAEFAVCVRVRVALPAVPQLVSGRGITEVGRYVVHLDDFRTTA